ncbi:MAG: TIGR02444 family protein [Halieaceae bacterium]
MPAANPFWDFSLDTYARPGVAAACLALQDQHGVDVNVLLYACFAAGRGVTLAKADLDAMDAVIEEWRCEVVKPLRMLRRRLPEATPLRDLVQQAELSAEQEQQGRMWELRKPAGDWPESGFSGELLAENLAALAAFYGLPVAAVAEFETLARP